MKVSTKHSHGLLAAPFLAALNLFLGGKTETLKNASSKVYYNLTLQVLSIEYTDYGAKFDAISDLTAATNLGFEKSNQIKLAKKRRR